MFALRSFLAVFISIAPVFCNAQTGPGGVGANDGSSNLRYWIDAERSSTGTLPVTAVTDLSGNNVVNTINGNPSFVANILNTRGVLRFDGSDALATNYSINAVTNPNMTIFTIHMPQIARAGSVWGEDNGNYDRFMTDIALAAPLLQSSVGAGYDHNSVPACRDIPGLFTTGVATLSNVVYREGVGNGTVVRVNGAVATTFLSEAADYGGGLGVGYSNLYVGAIGSNELNFNGDIAEMIIFNAAISTTQQIIVENYLSAKYNIAFNDVSRDVYTGDNLGYDFDVAGIGMTGGVPQVESRGTGIIRMSAANNLNNNEFLMWGHNNGAISATNIDVPAGVMARSNRIWYVSELNLAGTAVDVGSVTVSFDLTNLGPVTTNQLRLLVDSDNDGFYNDEPPIAGAVSLGNNVYGFENVIALVNGRTFTIATTNSIQTPLPVELIDFKAVANDNENTMTLTWTTALEKNNDRFEVCRSADANTWTTLGSINGSGNSLETNHYSFLDLNPLSGRAYYRLRQYDYDGLATYSKIISSASGGSNPLSVFPNPAGGMVVVSGADLQLPVQVFSFSGLDVTQQIGVAKRADGAVELDIHTLPKGEYILLCPGGRGKILKSDD